MVDAVLYLGQVRHIVVIGIDVPDAISVLVRGIVKQPPARDGAGAGSMPEDGAGGRSVFIGGSVRLPHHKRLGCRGEGTVDGYLIETLFFCGVFSSLPRVAPAFQQKALPIQCVCISCIEGNAFDVAAVIISGMWDGCNG